MAERWPITIAALAAIVAAPYFFEFYTFHLYLVRDPSFFTFSGSRLWVFLVFQVLLGAFIGIAKTCRPAILTGYAASAVAILISLLYHFCDPKQCYYPGPDGLGPLRLGALFFSTTAVGIMIGSSAKALKGQDATASILFGLVSALFVGYFPSVLLFVSYFPLQLGLLTLILASTLPFLLSGAIVSHFSTEAKHAVFSTAAAWLVLTVLLLGLRPPSMPLVVVMMACAIPSALAGFKLASSFASRRVACKSSTLLAALVAFFVLGASHPLIDAPMNLGIVPDKELLPQPTYYSGAYHYSETYHSSKRVEVEINLTQFNPNAIREFLVAGIGAQSPNCCKDGLDYGYRADLFFNNSGIFLAARAWETCDVNIACSGHSWESQIHQSIVRLPLDGKSLKTIMLAMEWQVDGRTVKWYHGVPAGAWKEYSQFVSPKIENPYFNLGVIPVGNPFTNPDTGNEFFFQVGISRPIDAAAGSGSIGFHCPAYYDIEGAKRCVDLEPIVRANSHWKALLKWGIQDTRTLVETDGSYAKITLT